MLIESRQNTLASYPDEDMKYNWRMRKMCVDSGENCRIELPRHYIRSVKGVGGEGLYEVSI